jgi:Leucine-rich repeat (LRR) protein
MEGLHGCPRLRRLWLSQNQIRTISDLHCVPELEELWLQSNTISSLQGLEACQSLTNLSLAGNLISDFQEVRRLSVIPSLSVVAFQDIHFGRCPIADQDGYKEFILNHLSQVTINRLTQSQKRSILAYFNFDH